MTESDKKNPFEMINKVEELPPELKQEVMATINFTHLATDIGKLFTVDMGRAAGKMLDPSSGEDTPNKN